MKWIEYLNYISRVRKKLYVSCYLLFLVFSFFLFIYHLFFTTYYFILSLIFFNFSGSHHQVFMLLSAALPFSFLPSGIVIKFHIIIPLPFSPDLSTSQETRGQGGVGRGWGLRGCSLFLVGFLLFFLFFFGGVLVKSRGLSALSGLRLSFLSSGPPPSRKRGGTGCGLFSVSHWISFFFLFFSVFVKSRGLSELREFSGLRFGVLEIWSFESLNLKKRKRKRCSLSLSFFFSSLLVIRIFFFLFSLNFFFRFLFLLSC